MFIKVNDAELYYEKEGTGQPLIMLHGNREDISIFSEARSFLKKSYALYLVDSRCHGKSSNPESLTYDAIASDVIAFIEKLELKRPVLYGFSDGAIAALLVASRRPCLISGLIASGANSKPEGLKRSFYYALKIKSLFFWNKYDALMLSGPCITREDLAKITVPALITAGENDAIRRKDTLFIASSIKDSKLLILKGENHSSYVVRSPKIAGIILSEFTSLR